MNKKRNKGKGKQNFSNSHFAQEENGTPKATISMDNHGDSPSKQIAQQPVATGTVRNVYEIPTSQLCASIYGELQLLCSAKCVIITTIPNLWNQANGSFNRNILRKWIDSTHGKLWNGDNFAWKLPVQSWRGLSKRNRRTLYLWECLSTRVQIRWRMDQLPTLVYLLINDFRARKFRIGSRHFSFYSNKIF